MPKLTDNSIRAAVNAAVKSGKDAVLRDADPVGLALRVRASGRHSWVFHYRRPGMGRAGRVQTVTLALYPTVDLPTARAKAKQLAADIVTGKDPATDRREEKAREKHLLDAVIDEHIADLRRRKIVNVTVIESTLKRGLAALLEREIGAVTRKDIVDRLVALEADGKIGASEYLRTRSHALLSWAVDRGFVAHNTLSGMRRPKASRAQRLEDDARQGKALNDDEIRALWAACDQSTPLDGMVRLGLLSGLRRGELAGLKWSDIKADRIVVEAHRAKTGQRHEVPLTDLMRHVLAQQPRTPLVPLVFGSMRKPGVEMSGWSKLLPRLVEKSGVNFRLHDLRRSARTLMSRLGVGEDIAELSIGHLRRDLVAKYNLDQAWEARNDAFQRISDHVAAIVGASDVVNANVSPLKPRRRAQ